MNPETFVNFGAVVTAIINFIIIAAVVYFVLIVPANAAKKKFVSEPEDKEASETDLLIQIRDILSGQPMPDTGAHAKSSRIGSPRQIRPALGHSGTGLISSQPP